MFDSNDEPRDDESRGSFVDKNRVCSVGEFFKGWRRKAGLVTLAMACVLTIGWMRSGLVRDEITLILPRRLHYLESRQGRIAWERTYGLFGFPTKMKWESIPATDVSYIEAHEDRRHSDWRWKFGGFGIGANSFKDTWRSNYWIAPYWSLVLPLTLLSAWLILAKPRNEKRTQAPIDSRFQEGQ